MNDDSLLLILDETLIHATGSPIDRQQDFRVGPYYVYKEAPSRTLLVRRSGARSSRGWSSASAHYIYVQPFEVARHDDELLWLVKYSDR